MGRRQFIAATGAAVIATSIAARAQQKAMPVIGYLGAATPGASAPNTAALRAGLRDTGFVEPQNVTIEYRWAEGHFERLPAMAADLVGRKVDVIVSGGTQAARAAKQATSTTPIIFFIGDDPVAEGLVASLARPGGNITGFSNLAVDLNPKRLELLRELFPKAERIALLMDPRNPNNQRVMRDMQEAAQAKGVRLHILKAASETEIDAAFASLAQLQADALFVDTDGFFLGLRGQIVALAARYAVPTIYAYREFILAGGLISYGPSATAGFRQNGIYAGRILKGAKPADLPVQQPTIFELVVNLKIAKALGLTVPPSILSRADEVIE